MKSILIIEDDIVFSRTISNWLVKQGMKTQCVATIAEARRAIAGKPFSLILADMRLPDDNSLSLLEWMRERRCTVPVIIMTNYGEVENAVTAIKLGATDYLRKPVQPDILLELIVGIKEGDSGKPSFYRGEGSGDVQADRTDSVRRHFGIAAGGVGHGEGTCGARDT